MKIESIGSQGRWTDEINRNEVSFAMDDAGHVTALVLHQFVPLTKLAVTEEN